MKRVTKWEIDQAHSVISFSVGHPMISQVKGTFLKFDASIYTAEKDFSTVEINLQIDVASVSTGDSKRDEHLRGNDFFDTHNHTHISFNASGMEKAGDSEKQELYGDLTIKDVTKRIKLLLETRDIVTDLLGNEKAGFKITGKINRSDWGLKWNQVLETGGLLVNEEVEIFCEIKLINMNDSDLIIDLDSRDDSYANPL